MPVLPAEACANQFKWQDVAPQDIPKENQDNLEATIHRAIELGINHIETARGYGTSEMQLGNILPTTASKTNHSPNQGWSERKARRVLAHF